MVTQFNNQFFKKKIRLHSKINISEIRSEIIMCTKPPIHSIKLHFHLELASTSILLEILTSYLRLQMQQSISEVQPNGVMLSIDIAVKAEKITLSSHQPFDSYNPLIALLKQNTCLFYILSMFYSLFIFTEILGCFDANRRTGPNLLHKKNQYRIIYPYKK